MMIFYGPTSNRRTRRSVPDMDEDFCGGSFSADRRDDIIDIARSLARPGR